MDSMYALAVSKPCASNSGSPARLSVQRLAGRSQQNDPSSPTTWTRRTGWRET